MKLQIVSDLHLDFHRDAREERHAWFETLQRLPFAATVHTRNGGRVGLVHG